MRLPAPLAAFACTTFVLALACSRPESAADTVATDTATAMTAAPASPMAAMQGRWNMRSIPMQGDTTPTVYTLDASGDTASWTINFAGRTEPVKLHVISMDGDSIVTRTDEYESARRRGVRTVTTSVMRVQGDRISGTVTARYRTTGPDSVLVLRSEGTRIP
jgi:hypothetical protein